LRYGKIFKEHYDKVGLERREARTANPHFSLRCCRLGRFGAAIRQTFAEAVEAEV
jgi:hypothetical protein